MTRFILMLLMVFLSQAAGASEASRFQLTGTITADPRDKDSVGVAMIEDKLRKRTIVVKVGQKVADSELVLSQVERKRAILKQGSREVILYRNAWDGDQITTASRSLDDRGGESRYQKESDYEVGNDTYDNEPIEQDFRAPPPPPPPVLPADDEDDMSGRTKRGGRAKYPGDDSLGEEIPGVYPE